MIIKKSNTCKLHLYLAFQLKLESWQLQSIFGFGKYRNLKVWQFTQEFRLLHTIRDFSFLFPKYEQYAISSTCYMPTTITPVLYY